MIDIFTKYALVKSFRDKKAKTVLNGFIGIVTRVKPLRDKKAKTFLNGFIGIVNES